mgnify:CR=1 FL=1
MLKPSTTFLFAARMSIAKRDSDGSGAYLVSNCSQHIVKRVVTCVSSVVKPSRRNSRSAEKKMNSRKSLLES